MKRQLNLIPIATQRRHLLRRVVRVGSIAVVVSGLVSATLLGGEWAQGWMAAQQLRELEARYAPLRQILAKQDALNQQIEQLRGRELLTLRLSRESRELTLLGAIARAAEQTSEGVFVQQLQYARPTLEAGLTPYNGELHLTGAGVDGGAIADFASNLRESGVFRAVSIESTSVMPAGSRSLRRYQLVCQL
ncbi:hypothetical protein MalM25_19670 [Planctomycetes bacterium MalM25]|nr:hypothetical protein MalM25_19670 [Planctomycetes bacterium MalM25]